MAAKPSFFEYEKWTAINALKSYQLHIIPCQFFNIKYFQARQDC
jgi:hypothetical protein